MSSQVQSSVLERRLRPIYEMLDAGEKKKALVEAEKVLKKTPNLTCAKALKALALIRMGKEAQAMAVLEPLVVEEPCDDNTLQAMAICYRELDQFEKISVFYQQAVKKNYQNEELHSHLFMSYVRVFDFKMQQQTAMALYKVAPKRPYYFWAVMSVLLQAVRTHAKDETKKQVLLSLAERMMEKMLNENTVEREQELVLYQMILEYQSKYERVLDLIKSPLAKNFLVTPVENLQLPILKAMKKWSELKELCMSILTDDPDLYNIWMEYLDSAFKLTQNIPKSNDITNGDVNIDNLEPIETTAKTCHDFITSLLFSKSRTGVDRPQRGPHLVRMELYNRLQSFNYNSSELMGDYMELLVDYFEKFGDKPCCFYDFKKYAVHLPKERMQSLLVTLLESVVGTAETTVSPESRNQILRFICALQIARYCGDGLDKYGTNTFIATLILNYDNAVDRYPDEHKIPTELHMADPYIILAVHVLFDVAYREKSSAPIFRALSLLEKLTIASPSNHHAKLLLVRLYHYLGVGSLAHKYYQTLDIKHVQLDSMSFLHFFQLPISGPVILYRSMCDTVDSFFIANYRDIGDQLTFSYTYGSFNKIIEFMNLREDLINSLCRYDAFVNRHWLQLTEQTLVQSNINEFIDARQFIQISRTMNPRISDDKQSIKNDDESSEDITITNLRTIEMSDNRDTRALVSFDAVTNTDKDEDLKDVFEQDRATVCLRGSFYNYCLSALKFVTCCDNEANVKEVCGKFLKFRQEFTSTHEWVLKRDFKPICLKRITGHLPSRLHKQLSSPYRNVLEPFSTLLVLLVCKRVKTSECINQILEEIPNARDSSCEVDLIKTCENEFIKMITELCDNQLSDNNSDFYLNNRVVHELVLNVREIVSTSVLFVSAIITSIKPQKTQQKKKKKSGNDQSNGVLNVEEIQVHMQRLINTLKEHITKMIDHISKYSSRASNVESNTDQMTNDVKNSNNANWDPVADLTARLNSVLLDDKSDLVYDHNVIVKKIAETDAFFENEVNRSLNSTCRLLSAL